MKWVLEDLKNKVINDFFDCSQKNCNASFLSENNNESKAIYEQ